MGFDKYFLKLDDIKVKEIDIDSTNENMLFALNKSKIGYFEFYSDKDLMLASDYMKLIFDMESFDNTTLFDLVNSIMSNENQFKLLEALNKTFEISKTFEYKIAFNKNDKLSWFEIVIDRFKDRFIGTIKNIDSLVTLESDVKGESNKLNQVFKSMPIPIYYYDYVGNILFANRKHKEDMSILNKIIEKYINGEKNVLERYKWITFFEIKAYHKELMKYEIHYEINQVKKINVVHRVIMESNSYESGILFLHEDASDIHLDDNQLTKILKANELIIEIKDLVDHVSDLNSMYDYLLSKIQTVIPSAKRACILKLDKNNEMYITASYGFSEEYSKSIRLPFNKSFANGTLRGDYSKSIILNDIQERYTVDYPNLNQNQHGFVFESNMTAPLVINGILYGLLSVDSDKNHIFDDVDLNLFDYMKLQIERAIIKFKKFSRVKENSILDPLTGIFNRRHVLDLFEQFCEDARQMNQTFAFVVFDLDKLKLMNDNYGHILGDKIIKQFAFISSSEMRETDVIARIGGDEFVGLFWDIDVAVLTEKISSWQETLKSQTIEFEGQNMTTEFSYGISVYPRDGKNFEELLDTSDKKMYFQKRGKEDL